MLKQRLCAVKLLCDNPIQNIAFGKEPDWLQRRDDDDGTRLYFIH